MKSKIAELVVFTCRVFYEAELIIRDKARGKLACPVQQAFQQSANRCVRDRPWSQRRVWRPVIENNLQTDVGMNFHDVSVRSLVTRNS